MEFPVNSQLIPTTIAFILSPVLFAQEGLVDLETVRREGKLRSSLLTQDLHPPKTTPKPRLDEFKNRIAPILKQSCVTCHGPDKQEGNIRIDTLDPNLVTGDDVDWWLEIMAVVNNEEMPPPDVELSDRDRSEIMTWLSTELQTASVIRRVTEGHSSFRRMTKYEYNYALQDLLGRRFDFADDLPPDSRSEDGFLNSSEMLHMTVTQFATYREVARHAIRRVTITGDQPAPLHWSISMKDAATESFAKIDEEFRVVREKHSADPGTLERELEKLERRHRNRPGHAHYRHENGRVTRVQWSYPGARFAWKPENSKGPAPPVSEHVAVLPFRQKITIELGDQIPDRGTLRVRVRASREKAEQEHSPSLQLEFGWQASNDSYASVGISDHDKAIEARPGKPNWYEWNIPLSEIYPRNGVRGINKMGDLPSPSEFIRLVNSSASHGGIQLDHVEISAPVYQEWPPRAHRQLFPEVPAKADEKAAAESLLSRFLLRAWRRPVTTEELARKMRLFEQLRPAAVSYQEAMTEVLATILSSPDFLYLGQPSQSVGADSKMERRLSNLELATRLATFLWASVPDDRLLDLATQEQLTDQQILSAEVRRMLADDRSQRFSRHFVRGWLGLDLLDYLRIDKKLHPQFDDPLKQAMSKEPILFFQHVLKHNRSVLDFLHADYTVLNERLAQHYGIPDIHGNKFRRVSLPGELQRGGLLTQPGLLAMNSDGADSHPLKRGIWVLECLLNDPPPPPPPAVPEIDLADPEIAKMSLKERIEDHRNHPACLSCHAKIDPWGIAFENFDATGRWRNEIKGQPVDAASVLFNGEPLKGIHGLKRYLLSSRQDQFARALVHKLATYAMGRPLTFGDRSEVDQIAILLRKNGDGLATLIEQLVLSDLFQTR